jgi:hypothetical protein
MVILPAEANTPRIVYPYAVLALSVRLQCFQTIAGRHAQVIQTSRMMHQQQFPPRHPLNLRRQTPRRFIVEQLFGLGAGETAYHLPPTITHTVIDRQVQAVRSAGPPWLAANVINTIEADSS